MRLGGSGSGRLIYDSRDESGRFVYLVATDPLVRVYFDEGANVWEVHEADGTVAVYGDEARDETVEYAVVFANRFGVGGTPAVQSRVPTTWMLAKKRLAFGQQIVFEYEADRARVDETSNQGLEYTRATYLSAINGIAGDRIELVYAEREPYEYTPYHGALASLYQDRYETRYLSAVRLLSPAGNVLRETRLSYDTIGDADAYRKRTLVSVTGCTAADPGPQPTYYRVDPDTRFTYFGQSGGDGVSRATPQSGTALYGALKQIILPSGLKNSLSYQTVRMGASQRDAAVDLEGGSDPRAYFAGDYSLLTAYTGTALRLVPCTREGRWMAAAPVSLTCSSEAYTRAQVVVHENCFAVLAGSALYLAYRDARRPDAWTSNQFVVNAGDPVLAGSDRFFAVLDRSTGQMSKFTFTNSGGTLAWSLTAAPMYPAGGAGSIAAKNNTLLVLAVAASVQGNPILNFTIQVLGEDGRWSQTGTRRQGDFSSVPSRIDLTAGDGFAQATCGTGTPGGRVPLFVDYVAFTWDADFRNLTSEYLTGRNSAPAAAAAARESVAYVPPRASVAGWQVGVDENQFRLINEKDWRQIDLKQLLDYSPLKQALTTAGPILGETETGSKSSYFLVGQDPAGKARVDLLLSQMSQDRPVASQSGADLEPAYVVLNGTLYYRDWNNGLATNGYWVQASGIGSMPAETGTVALGDGYLAYETGGDVQVYALREGVATRAETLSGRQILGAGPKAFAVYSGSLASPAAVTLHRYADGAVTGLIAVPALAGTAVDDGERIITTTCTLATGNSTANGASLFTDGPGFNRVAITATGASGLSTGSQEYYFFTGPSDGRTGTAALTMNYPDPGSTDPVASLLCGMGYTHTIKNTNGVEQSNTTTAYQVTLGTAGAADATVRVRVARTDLTVNDLATFREFDYDSIGREIACRANSYDLSGAMVTEETRSTYFDAYPEYAGAKANLSGVRVSTLRQVRTGAGSFVVTDVSVTTFRDWNAGADGGEHWAPFKQYLGTAPDADPAVAVTFDATNPLAEAAPSAFTIASVVLERTASGWPKLTRDAGGRFHSFVFDAATGTIPVAGFAGARYDLDQCAYTGFEAYEPREFGGWFSADGRALTGNIRSDDSFTGTRSYYLAAGDSGPCREFFPEASSGRFVFSCYAKGEANYTGRAVWRIGVYAVDSLLQTLELPVPATAQRWTYLQKVIDLRAIVLGAGQAWPGPYSLFFTCDNSSGADAVRLDHLRFAPVDAGFTAAAYDFDRRLATAMVGTNGEARRTLFDSADVPVGIVAGPQEAGRAERTRALSANSISRLLTGTDAVDPNLPDHALNVTQCRQSAMIDFRNARGSDWSFAGGAGAWEFQNGALVGTGGSSVTAAFAGFDVAFFALRVRLARRDGGAVVTTGTDQVMVTRDGSGWHLGGSRVTGAYSASGAAGALNEDLLLVVVDNFAVAYADGRQLFAAPINAGSGNPGPVKLGVGGQGTAAFRDFALCDEPAPHLNFSDATGRTTQSLAILGGLPLAEDETGAPVTGVRGLDAGALYDELGRQIAGRRPTPVSLQFNSSGRLTATPTSYLAAPNGTPVSRTDYLNGTGETTADGTVRTIRDYFQTLYEPGAFAYPVQAVLPHATDAEAADFTKTVNLLNDANCDVFADIVGSPSSARFAIAETIDGNGTKSYALADLFGRPLLRRVLLADGSSLTTGTVYDAAGNLIETRPPNFYRPPAASTARDWVETRTFDFLRRQLTHTTPDAGTTLFLYDTAGRLRFRQSASNSAARKVVYRKYDGAGRVIEKGLIDWSASFSSLQTYVDRSAWPVTDNVSDTNYQAGEFRKKYEYDFDANEPGALYLLGRLRRTLINNNAAEGNPAPDAETRSYDADGQVSVHTALVRAAGEETFSTAYARDENGRVTCITYPGTDGESPLKVGYYHDWLGRLISIGDAPDDQAGLKDRYAAYAYDRLGRIVTEKLNNEAVADGEPGEGGENGLASVARTYGFDVTGLLTKIDDPYFRENLEYTIQGESLPQDPPASPRYTGRINATEFRFKDERWNGPPANYRYAFTYDSVDRLVEALHSADPGASLAFAAEPPDQVPDAGAGFDPGGNLLTYRRGLSRRTYSYADANGTSQQNRVQGSMAATDASLDLANADAGARRAGPFAWGSSNGGPSASGVVGAGSQASVRIDGGGRGHYEYLRLESYLEGRGRYTLDFEWKVGGEGDAALSAAAGDAGWYVSAKTPEGRVFAKKLASLVDTGGNFATGSTLTIDVALVLGRTTAEPVSQVRLEFRNGLRARTGGPGPAVELRGVRLVSVPDLSVSAYAYDAGGAITSTYTDSTRATSDLALNFDQMHRRVLTVLRTPRENPGSPLNSAFRYGAADQRVFQSVGVGDKVASRLYLHGGRATPLTVVDQAAPGVTARQSYIHGPRGLIAIRGAGGITYVLKDHLGSTRVLVNEQGAVERFFDYLPYGGLIQTGSGTGAPAANGADAGDAYRFTGQEKDQASGLYNFRARLYDPDLRRFFSPDPVSQAGSPYAYVGGNPISRTDPSGMVGEDLVECFTSNATRWYEYVGCTINAPSIAFFGAGYGAGALILLLFFGLLMRLLYAPAVYGQGVGPYRRAIEVAADGNRDWTELQATSRNRSRLRRAVRAVDAGSPAQGAFRPPQSYDFEQIVGDHPVEIVSRGPLMPRGRYLDNEGRYRGIRRVYYTNLSVNIAALAMIVPTTIGFAGFVISGHERLDPLIVVAEGLAAHTTTYLITGFLTEGFRLFFGPLRNQTGPFQFIEWTGRILGNLAASGIAFGARNIPVVPLTIFAVADVILIGAQVGFLERAFGRNPEVGFFERIFQVIDQLRRGEEVDPVVVENDGDIVPDMPGNMVIELQDLNV